MSLARLRTNNEGFTLLELLIVVALVVILFVTALENLLPLRGDAERATVLSTTGSLRSAIGLESNRRAVHGGAEAMIRMDGANPMEWLLVAPATYAGELSGTEFERVAPGDWAFFRDSGILFYRVRYPEYFEGDFDSPAGIRYRVSVTMGARQTPTAIGLNQLDSGRWNTSGSELERWMEAILP